MVKSIKGTPGKSTVKNEHIFFYLGGELIDSNASTINLKPRASIASSFEPTYWLLVRSLPGTESIAFFVSSLTGSGAYIWKFRVLNRTDDTLELYSFS